MCVCVDGRVEATRVFDVTPVSWNRRENAKQSETHALTSTQPDSVLSQRQRDTVCKREEGEDSQEQNQEEKLKRQRLIR